jgi:hypothetical protein
MQVMSELSYSILINTSNRFPGHPPAGEQEIRSTLNCTRRANQPPIPTSPEEYTIFLRITRDTGI